MCCAASRDRENLSSSSELDSELERELAPFVEQARAKAKSKENAQDHESDLSDLSDLQSSDFEGLEGTGTVRVESSGQDGQNKDSGVGAEIETSASASLQLRPKRARQMPARYQGSGF